MTHQPPHDSKDAGQSISSVVEHKIEPGSYERFVIISARDQVIRSVFEWLKAWVYNPLVWIVCIVLSGLAIAGVWNTIGMWIDHAARSVAEQETKEIFRRAEERQDYLFERMDEQVNAQEKKLAALNLLCEDLLKEGARMRGEAEGQSKAIENQWSSLKSFEARVAGNETALLLGKADILLLTHSLNETSSTLELLYEDVGGMKKDLPRLANKLEEARRGMENIENSMKRMMVTELGTDEEFLNLAQTEYPDFDEPDAKAIRESLFLRAAMAERLILLTKSVDPEVRAKALRGMAVVHLIARDADLERRVRQSKTFATESEFRLEFYTQAVDNVLTRYALVRPDTIVEIIPLLSDPSENVRELAAQFLSRVRFDDPADARMLLRHMLQNPDESKSLAHVVLALNPQEFEKISEDLLQALTSQASKENAVVLYFALAVQPGLKDRILDMAVDYLNKDSLDPRFEISYNFAMNRCSPEDQRFREWVRKHANQASSRKLALGFIGRVYDQGDEEMMEILDAALSSSDVDVKEAATEAFKEIIVRELASQSGLDPEQPYKWTYYKIFRTTERSFLGIKIGPTKVVED